ncbi:DUF190 domain-containing protein [Desulfovibrio cuneatus]|uniref:DUF190 domain-containing protein n=1 Tax=Desulfovibrio cuneatus TaxID=159728 RepID=UPI0003F703D3|nr:DUF190 domain-containing protein [Desulfovibrio cuneatus]
MHGFQISFYTQQGRRHKHMSIAEWLMQEAKSLGIAGATVTAAQGGYGRDGLYCSSHFFELGDQPVEVSLAVNATQADQLFARVIEEKVPLFYIKTPIEFGIIGEEQE